MEIIIYLDEDDPVRCVSKLNLACDNIIFCKSKQDNIKTLINTDDSLNISSKENHGINNLYDRLSTVLSTQYKYNFKDDPILISDRQILIFKEAHFLLEQIQKMLEEDVGMDIVASHMHELTHLFDECLGKVSNDSILESIFSTFCVGK